MWANELRPKTMAEVIGQDSAIKTLMDSKESSTFILHGPSGVGKTSLARIFANDIDSEIIEINGSDNNGVDAARSLIDIAKYEPVFNKHRTLIIDEAHFLTTAAWNALLKILEESPKTTKWIICTTEFSKIPVTIKTRAVVIRLQPISRALIASYLSSIADHKMLPEAVRGHISEISMRSEGRLREAITALETLATTSQLPYSFSTLDAIKFLKDCFDYNKKAVVATLETMSHEDVKFVINFMYSYLKFLVLLQDGVGNKNTIMNQAGLDPAYTEPLREMQASLWNSCPIREEQLVASVTHLYNFYNRIMIHYNDFAETPLSFGMAVMRWIGGTDDL